MMLCHKLLTSLLLPILFMGRFGRVKLRVSVEDLVNVGNSVSV